MGSVAAGLGAIGGSVGQALELRRQERLKAQMDAIRNALEQGQLGIQQRRLSLEEQRANRPSYLGMEKVGNEVALFYQNPDGTTAVKRVPLGPGMDSFYEATKRSIEGITDPAIKREALDEAGLYFTMGDTKGAFNAVKERINRAQQESADKARQRRSEDFSKEQQQRQFAESEKLVRMRKAAGEESGDDEVDAYTDDLMNRRITVDKVPAKIRGKVLANIRSQGKMPPRALSVTEQRLLDNINTIEPTLDSLEGVIKAAGLDKDNSPIAPRTEWIKYRYLKIAPEGARGDLIRNSAALQVMGAAPWIQIGRGKYLFETISNHLPNPEDSPKLLMDKIKFLRGILAESKKSLGVEEESPDSILDKLFGPPKAAPNAR